MSSDTKSSKSRKISHAYYKYSRYRRQEVLATELRNKEKHRNQQHNDPSMVKNGKLHFELGFTLEEADENLRNNNSFVAGYNWAKHIAQCALDSYDLGFLHYLSGELLENANDIYVTNENFRNGYFDAEAQTMIDGISLNDVLRIFNNFSIREKNPNMIKKIRK